VGGNTLWPLSGRGKDRTALHRVEGVVDSRTDLRLRGERTVKPGQQMPRVPSLFKAHKPNLAVESVRRTALEVIEAYGITEGARRVGIDAHTLRTAAWRPDRSTKRTAGLLMRVAPSVRALLGKRSKAVAPWCCGAGALAKCTRGEAGRACPDPDIRSEAPRRSARGR
jgi:hypothetical protein